MEFGEILLYSMVVLQRSRDVKRAQDIKNRLTKRMDAWEKGKLTMLIQDTEQDIQTYL